MDEVLRAADEAAASDGLASPRLRFFLEHQLEIRTWQALAGETWEEVAKVIADLGAELTDLGVAMEGFEVARRVLDRIAYGPVLFRRSWCLDGTDLPPVGFAIGWDGRPNPGRSWPNTGLPYYGVVTSPSDPGPAIKAALRPVMQARLADGDPPVSGFKVGSQWSVYRPFDKDYTWWTDIAAWRRRIAEQFVAAARTWDPVVTAAVATLRSTEG